jgi:hypothetical protein
VTRFVPCGECRRHVREDDAACPFCSTPIAPAAEGPAASSVPRLTRAAIFAGAVVLATAAAAGCGDRGGGGNPDAGMDATLAMPYGAPPARDRLA